MEVGGLLHLIAFQPEHCWDDSFGFKNVKHNSIQLRGFFYFRTHLAMPVIREIVIELLDVVLGFLCSV